MRYSNEKLHLLSASLALTVRPPWLILKRRILATFGFNRNFHHVLGVVSQNRVSGGNQTHGRNANSLAHYPLDYQGTHIGLLRSIK